MRTLFALMLVSALIPLSPLISARPAAADSLSCSSVNGETQCTGSGGLSCRSVDGKMVCAPGSSGSCESAGDRIVCRNGSVTQTFRTGRQPQPEDHGARNDGTSPVPRSEPLPRGSGQWLSIQQDRHGQSLIIEQPGLRLHLGNGALDSDLD